MKNADRLSIAMERSQKARAALLAHLHGLSQAQFDFKPSESAWSVGEVVHHVCLTEKVFQGYMRDLLQAGGPVKGASRIIRFDELPMGPQMIPTSLLRLPPLLLPFSIMSSLMPESWQSSLLANPVVKVKTAPQVEPKAGIPRATLLELLSRTRRDTLVLLEPVQDWDLTRFRWFHPLMGGHDLYGTLDLVASHDRRHAGQIERVTKDPRFPPAESQNS